MPKIHAVNIRALLLTCILMQELTFMFCLFCHFSDDVEFEVSSDRRTGKPIAVKLVKIKAEMLPEERISGQVGPDLQASPLTVLHGFIHPVKEHILLSCFIVLVPLMSIIVGGSSSFLIHIDLEKCINHWFLLLRVT